MLNRLLSGMLSITLVGVLAACGQLNDDPKAGGTGGTIRLPIDGLVSQMGASSALTSPTGDDATTPIKGLIIGAIVTSRTTPYTTDTTITESLKEQIEDDLTNSVNYFQIVKLPTASAFVSFNIPPPGAGNWQIAALGVDPVPDFLADLADAAEFENAPKYYGFNETFLNTNTVAGTTISLTMKRACLLDEAPLGCAQFDENGQPQVTTGVEIVGVRVTDSAGNVTNYSDDNTFPIVVRANPISGQSTVAEAESALSALSVSTAAGNDVTVRTTHTLSSRSSPACRALSGATSGTGTPVSTLDASLGGACEVQTYTTPYQ